MSIDKFLSTLLATADRIATSLEAIVESQGIVAGTTAPRPAKDEGDIDLDHVFARVHSSMEEETEDPDLEEEIDDDLDLDEEEADDDLDLDEEEEEVEPVSTKKKTTKKKTKKVTKKKVGRTSKAKGKITEDEVRAKLKDLQITTGSKAQVTSLLKRHGATTLGNLKVAKYKAVIDGADTTLSEYE